MARRPSRIEHPDPFDELARLRAAGAWRGAVVQRRGGASRALARIKGAEDRQLALALKMTEPGMVLMVHTRTCKRRNDSCGCAGVRLVAGASA